MVDLRRRAIVVFAALLPLPTPAATSGVEEFLRLSERLTGKAGLGKELAAIYLDALLAVPGNAEILARLARGAGTRTEPELALERTILEWWYTGAYVVAGERRIASHDDALMWRALGRNAPGTCAGEFGAWSRPPRQRA